MRNPIYALLNSFIACIIELFYFSPTTSSVGQKKKKPISTLLNAKWSNTPMLLEVNR